MAKSTLQLADSPDVVGVREPTSVLSSDAVQARLDGLVSWLAGPSVTPGQASARLDVVEALLDGIGHPDPDPAVKFGDEARAEREEVRRALHSLLARGSARRRDGWDRVVEVLVNAPPLDDAQLHQARLHAGRRRWVLDNVVLLDAAAVLELLPERLGGDGNVSRALGRLRTTGQLLGLDVRREWRYPAAQFDAHGHVHRALIPALAKAMGQSYSAWEITDWLARPTPPEENLEPGRPPDGVEADTSWEKMAALVIAQHPERPAPTPGPAPFALLAAGDDAAFGSAARRWLG